METLAIFPISALAAAVIEARKDGKLDQTELFNLVKSTIQVLRALKVKVPKKFVPEEGEDMKAFLHSVVDELL